MLTLDPRAVRLDRPHLVTGLREDREEFRQRRIDAQLECPVPLEQVLAVREVEARIGLEIRKEGLQVAVEADRAPHPVHLAQDRLHRLLTTFSPSIFEALGSHLWFLIP